MTWADVLDRLSVSEPEHLQINPNTGRAIPYAFTVPPELTGMTDADRLVASQLLTLSELTELRRQTDDRSRPVDEYQTETVAATTLSQITLLPQFQKLNVRIEHILISGPSQGVAKQSEGSVTSPGAAAQITQITVANLTPGTYTVNWAVDLDGTVGAGDANNFNLTGPGLGGGLTSENNGAIGHYAQDPIQVTVPFGNNTTLKISSIAAGTVGAIYSAQLSIQPITSYPVTLQLGDRTFNLVIPATGVLELAPKVMLLSPQDQRILTAAIPGEYTLELMGWADVRY